MENNFYELVIEGHLPVIRGFVYGLLEGSEKKGTVFFSRENNIKRETFLELFMEWAHLRETLRHVVVDEEVLELIKQSLESTADILELKLKSVKKIKKASFSFHYEVYAQKYGEEIKGLFANLPPQLQNSSDYQPKEEIIPECEGVEAYTACHAYNLKAKGSVEGPVDVLLPFYKKIQENELIKEDQIVLHFAS
jgi:hypothetical protein